MATDAEIRNIRRQAIFNALHEKITRPWWGSSTELLDTLQLRLPPYVAVSPPYLSALLTAFKADGLLNGWTKAHWRTPSKRLLVLIPPGWVWDDASGRWFLHGIAQPAPHMGP